jgi:hypothetical protein
VLLPNVSSMYKWVNDFFAGAGAQSGGSQDFLQCIRASDGKILGWIDETGTLRGSLAPSGSGIRILNGSGNGNYGTSSNTYVAVDKHQPSDDDYRARWIHFVRHIHGAGIV